MTPAETGAACVTSFGKDPIGVGTSWRKNAEDEYDCVLEEVVSLLSRHANVAEISTNLDAFLLGHFGIAPQPEQATAFAERIAAWCEARGF